MDIIVGLGNPGQQYRHTRHNIGFAVIDALACRYAIPMRQHGTQALYGAGQLGHRQVMLVRPQTYMNLSGHAVAPLVHGFVQPGEELVVIHDDIDLPLGKIRVKRQGGDAGHRGVRSIIECLGHGTFVRVRLGVGRPPHQEDIVDYVLSPFTAEEHKAQDDMIAQALACVEMLLESTDQSCES